MPMVTRMRLDVAHLFKLCLVVVYFVHCRNLSFCILIFIFLNKAYYIVLL